MPIPTRFRYRIERRGGSWNAVFPELPSANFSAAAPQSVLEQAPDRALAALSGELARGFVPFAKKPHAGEGTACLPMNACAKALFIEHAWTLGVQPSDAARALEITRQEAARLYDLSHPTKIDALERALNILGYSLMLTAVALPEGPSELLAQKPRRGRPYSRSKAD